MSRAPLAAAVGDQGDDAEGWQSDRFLPPAAIETKLKRQWTDLFAVSRRVRNGCVGSRILEARDGTRIGGDGPKTRNGDRENTETRADG